MPDAAIEQVTKRLAISDVLIRYARGVDRRDWDLVASCFTEDAYVAGSRFEAPLSEYLPMLRRSVDAFGVTMHFMGNQTIEVDEGGQRAEVETYAVAFHFHNTDPTVADLIVGVRYHDEVVADGDGWRVRRREVSADWTREGDALATVANSLAERDGS